MVKDDGESDGEMMPLLMWFFTIEYLALPLVSMLVLLLIYRAVKGVGASLLFLVESAKKNGNGLAVAEAAHTTTTQHLSEDGTGPPP